MPAEDAVSHVPVHVVYLYMQVPLMQVKLQYYETASTFFQIGVVDKLKKVCIFIIVISLFCINAYTKIIDNRTKHIIYEIGLSKGVPKSITDRLMYEESKYDDHAESEYTNEGYNSKGLFQIYTRPDNLEDIFSVLEKK